MKAYAATAILYHFTHYDSAIQILTDKLFRLSNTAFREAEADFGKHIYYLSTSRTLTTNFNNTTRSVVFQLDGIKLAANNKIKPVNFWQSLDAPTLLENEDRILSLYPVIPIKDIVISVHVPLKSIPDSAVQKIKRLCIRQRIPVYFYNADTLYSLNAKKRISVPLSILPMSPAPLPHSGIYNDNNYNRFEHINKKKNNRLAYLITKALISKLDTREATELKEANYTNVKLPLSSIEYSQAVLNYMRKHDLTIEQANHIINKSIT